jgi:hypothetical protein
MKFRKLILLCFLLVSASAFSQTWLWGHHYGTSSFDYGRDVVTDFDGNVFYSGTIADSGYFLTDTIVGPAQFLAKYDSLGNEIWIKHMFGNIGSAPYIDCDTENNLYYYTRLDADTTIFGSDTLLKTEGILAVIKLDSDGNFLWSKNFIYNSGGGTSHIQQGQLTVGFNDHVYLTGTFFDTAYFESTTLFPSNGNMFVVNFSPDGTEIWVSQFGALAGPTASHAYEITSDEQHAVYVSGRFTWPSVFGEDTLIPQVDWGDGFITKINPNGQCSWVVHAKGLNPGPSSGAGASTQIIGLAYDNNGHVYSAGGYNAPLIFGDSILTNPYGIFTNCGFVTKYDTSGQFIWAKYYHHSFFDDITCDAAGNLYGIGRFMDSIQFDTTLFTINPYGSNDLFVTKFNANGTTDWALNANARIMSSPELSIGKCQLNKAYISGSYIHPIAEFGGINLPASTSQQAFIACVQDIASLSECYFVSLPEEDQSNSDLVVFPNPAFQSVTFLLENSQESIEQVVLFDLSGRALLTLDFSGHSECTISIEHIPAGVYFYSVQKTSGEFISGKLIVQ